MRKFLKCCKCKVMKPFKYLSNAKQWIKNLFKCCKNEKIVLFQPQLSHEKLTKISEPQAKIIYDEAKNILKDNQDSIKSLTAKADVIFKYLFTIQSAQCGLYLWLVKNPNSESIIILPNFYLLLLGFALLLIPSFIYAVNFLTPIATKGANNPPISTLKEKADLRNRHFLFM